MCFEKDALMCHRGRVVNHLNKLLEGSIPNQESYNYT